MPLACLFLTRIQFCTVLLINLMLCVSCIYTKSNTAFVVIIEPAGNVRNPGRKLPDSFERGATLQCAELLKKKLEQQDGIEVILTRTAGSCNTQEQNAQIANRLHADLYIHLSFFHEIEVKPRLFIYTFSYHNDFPIKQDSFIFCPYDQAHCLALEKTAVYAHVFEKCITSSPYAIHFMPNIPYTPLKGVICPAMAIEIGLHITPDWRECIPFLTQSIHKLIETINNE